MCSVTTKSCEKKDFLISVERSCVEQGQRDFPAAELRGFGHVHVQVEKVVGIVSFIIYCSLEDTQKF